MRLAAIAAMVWCLFTSVGLASAQVPESVWKAMKERQVLVGKTDGMALRGKLIGIDGATIVVLVDDGRAVPVAKRMVASVRARRSPGPGHDSSPPHATADAVENLYLEIRGTPIVDLPKLLNKRRAAVVALPAADKMMLLERFEPGLGNKLLGFGLNFLLFPGIGSLAQGDTGYGVTMLGGAALGIGLIIGGFAQELRTGNGAATFAIGAGMLTAASIAGWIRPWFYRGGRFQILSRFFADPTRYSGTVRVLPTLIAQPIGLAPGGGLVTHNLYGAGITGRF